MFTTLRLVLALSAQVNAKKIVIEANNSSDLLLQLLNVNPLEHL